MGTHPIFESDFDCLTDAMIETMPGDDDWVDTESDIESQNSDLSEFEHTKKCKNINRWVLPVENDTYNWRKIKLLTNLEYFEKKQNLLPRSILKNSFNKITSI